MADGRDKPKKETLPTTGKLSNINNCFLQKMTLVYTRVT